MKKNKIFVTFSIVVGILLSIYSYQVIVSNKNTDNIYECNVDLAMKNISQMRLKQKDYSFIELNIPEIATEGASAKIFYDRETKELKMIDVISFVSLAKYSSTYYIQDNKVFYINSVIDEWDPTKLYGSTGELTVMEGEYVIATSTREGYLIKDEKLCEYFAEKSRKKSIAVSEANPEKDAKELLDTFRFIQEKIKYNN